MRRLVLVTKVHEQPGYAWTSTRWLRRLIYEGRLPSYKFGGRRLVDLDDVDAAVDAGREDRHGAA